MRNIEGSIVAGGEFITAIEQRGLIGFIDNYALEQTVRELADCPGIRLGLNVSSLTACEGSWIRSASSRLRHRSDLARRLVVEITETATLDDIEEASRFVDALHKMGCRVALDDFGAGYSSPRHLQSLAVDTIKIDGSFVRNLSESSEQRIVLSDLVDLIKGFGFATVAEGIESAEEAALVCAAGVGYLQGFHIGPPTIERTWLGMAPADSATMRRSRLAPSRPLARGVDRWPAEDGPP